MSASSEPDYPTCARCYATLCANTGGLDPAAVYAHLGIALASIQHEGLAVPELPWKVGRFNGWFLSSKGRLSSRDLRDHLDWLFEMVEPRRACIEALRAGGCRFYIFCFWISKDGHGGPIISVSQSQKLAEFQFDLDLDIYFVGGPDSEDEAARGGNDGGAATQHGDQARSQG